MSHRMAMVILAVVMVVAVVVGLAWPDTVIDAPTVTTTTTTTCPDGTTWTAIGQRVVSGLTYRPDPSSLGRWIGDVTGPLEVAPLYGCTAGG